MDDFVFLSALNQYDYCPRRCYYIFVENTFLDNEHTVEGSLQHVRANSGETSARDDALQLRSVYLYSHKLGISGKADVIEERAGEIYPVEHKRGKRRVEPFFQESSSPVRDCNEHKKGRRGQWTNDALQLCAQALCLEEMTGRTVGKGYLYYAATGRRQEIEFSPELRQQTLETIAAVRRLIESGERPPNPYTPRCKGCSLYDVCLPKESAQLRGEAKAPQKMHQRSTGPSEPVL
jgi:CRISPR-associated exonuclease Cas4